MKTVSLTWYQRIILWNRIGTLQVANLKAAQVYFRILDKIRPSDVEQRDAQLTMIETGYQWRLPEAGFGDKDIEFEDEEGRHIAEGLNGHPQPITVADAEWMLHLIAALEPRHELVDV